MHNRANMHDPHRRSCWLYAAGCMWFRATSLAGLALQPPDTRGSYDAAHPGLMARLTRADASVLRTTRVLVSSLAPPWSREATETCQRARDTCLWVGSDSRRERSLPRYRTRAVLSLTCSASFAMYT
jgi:hypothetical protein